MIRVTVRISDDEVEEDSWPRGAIIDVDGRDRLIISSVLRDEASSTRRAARVAIYPAGHWIRAWIVGEADDDEEYNAEDVHGPAFAGEQAPFSGNVIPMAH